MHPALPAALIALSCLAALPARALGPLAASDETAHPVPQASVMVANTPDITDCTALDALYARGGWPQVKGPGDLAVLDRMLRARFRARADGRRDLWSPQLARLLSGSQVVGDCDDLATSAIALAICAGVPAQDLGLLMTTNPLGGTDRHLVALYRAPDGQVWTFGNTLGRAAPLPRNPSPRIAWTRADRLDRWWSLTDRDQPRSTATLDQPARD
ncbi:MAG TPA: hypothetical protein VLA78_00945 [Paracoccaceae bacterium]|nr:hypothetical protein [Paracoccaceae bacterium]